MKRFNIFYCMLVAASLTAGCTKDNYQAPNAGLYGALLDANTNDTVFGAAGPNTAFGNLILYQLNYASIPSSSITSAGFKYDGTYANSALFNGMFQVVPSGPYSYTDTVVGNVKGNTHLDIKVVPFAKVTSTIGTITDSSISVSVNVSRSSFADAIQPQPISEVDALLGTTQAVDVNDYLVINGDNSAYRYLVSTGSYSNQEITDSTFTYTFQHLTPKTTYYIRGAATVSAGNPNSYYNYSRIITVTTPE